MFSAKNDSRLARFLGFVGKVFNSLGQAHNVVCCRASLNNVNTYLIQCSLRT